MRYYLLSFIIHIFVLLGGFIASQSLSLPRPSERPPYIVDMILSPEKPSKSSSLRATVAPKRDSLENREGEPYDRKELQALTETSEEIRLDASKSTGAAGKQPKLHYAQELKTYLERNKHYPRQAIRLKQSGTLTVRVRIDSDGTFKRVELVSPSSFPILDRAAIDLLKRLGRFKPLPAHIQANTNFTIPIAFMMGAVQ